MCFLVINSHVKSIKYILSYNQTILRVLRHNVKIIKVGTTYIMLQ